LPVDGKDESKGKGLRRSSKTPNQLVMKVLKEAKKVEEELTAFVKRHSGVGPRHRLVSLQKDKEPTSCLTELKARIADWPPRRLSDSAHFLSAAVGLSLLGAFWHWPSQPSSC
jgi:hypothetical protein